MLGWKFKNYFELTWVTKGELGEVVRLPLWALHMGKAGPADPLGARAWELSEHSASHFSFSLLFSGFLFFFGLLDKSTASWQLLRGVYVCVRLAQIHRRQHKCLFVIIFILSLCDAGCFLKRCFLHKHGQEFGHLIKCFPGNTIYSGKHK